MWRTSFSSLTVSFEYFIWNLENCVILFLSFFFFYFSSDIQVNGNSSFRIRKKIYLWLKKPTVICFPMIFFDHFTKQWSSFMYLPASLSTRLPITQQWKKMGNQSRNGSIINRAKEQRWKMDWSPLRHDWKYQNLGCVVDVTMF